MSLWYIAKAFRRHTIGFYGRHAMKRLTVVIACFWMFAVTASGSAAIITFDNLLILDTQEVVEDGMRYKTAFGAFVVSTVVGNPPSGLLGSPQAPGVFTVTRDGGGDFTFDRYDFSSFGPPQQSDTWEFRGLLDGIQQFAFFDATSTSFLTRITNLSDPIDELDITVVSESMAAAVADNFVFTLLPAPIPEPSTLALLGFPIIVFGFVMAYRRLVRFWKIPLAGAALPALRFK
jgi:hypothetical protein